MGDTFREVTGQSWFSRIGDSIKGILIGLLLIVIAFPVLFWNEGRAVKRARTLEQGQKTVITIQADPIDAANEGKLVFVSAAATAKDAAKDANIGVSAEALLLERQVEMYQWKETKSQTTKKNTLGGGTTTETTYTYDKVWESELVSSQNFKVQEGHANPPQMALSSESFPAPGISLGAFNLPDAMVRELPASRSVPVTDATLASMPPFYRPKAKISGDMIYLANDVANPEVGDLRMTFHAVPTGVISLIAQQHGSTFEPYTAPAGGTIEFIRAGEVTADAMFHQAEVENERLTWILRGVGFLAFLFGFAMVFRPLAVLADIVPFFGGLVGVGTFAVALLLALVCSTLTIAIGWLFYRPLIAVPLLILAAACTYAAVHFLHRRRTPAAPQ